MTINFQDHSDGTREYTDRHGNQIALAYFDPESSTFRFKHVSMDIYEGRWPMLVQAHSMETLDRVAWAMESHIRHTGH